MSKKKYTTKGKNKTKHAVNKSTDVHHYWWPKALYRVNKLLTLQYDFHHGYHEFFLKYCYSGYSRARYCEYCQYRDICCYHDTLEDYGTRLQQTNL